MTCVINEAYRYTCRQLLELRRCWPPKSGVREVIHSLGCARPRRGCRAGQRRRDRRAPNVNNNIVSRSADRLSDCIPTVLTSWLRRTQHDTTLQMYHGRRETRLSSLIRVRRCAPVQHVRLGLFNSRSVANKSASIQRWISDSNLNIAVLVETWHDDAASPDLIACVPPGFRYVEKARPRRDELSLSTNHGGVCLLYDGSLHARLLQLPTFTTLEAVAAYVHRSGFNAVFVVIYRPGSQAITQSFFDDMNRLLESMIIYSTSLIILGDLNVHVDDISSPSTNKFLDILATHNLVQHVTSPTHQLGHTLDVVITRTEKNCLNPISRPAAVVGSCVCRCRGRMHDITR